MPTAAKMFAAVAFAALSFLVAHLYRAELPEGTQTRLLGPVCAGIGLLCGWLICGPLVGRGYRASMGTGVRTSATIVFWAVLTFSVYEMILRSTKMLYDGPMEAVLGVFDLMLRYSKLLLAPNVLAALLLGGLASGWIAEWAGKRWR